MKPIEAGCLAILVGSYHEHFNGRVLRVVRFVGRMPVAPEIGDRFWLCAAAWIPSDVEPYATEQHLIRIDGFEEETEALEAIGVESA